MRVIRASPPCASPSAVGGASVFVTRPISAGLIAVADVLLAIEVVPIIRRRRDQVFAD
jgi:putative tricarboxylic transport membrane protein